MARVSSLRALAGVAVSLALGAAADPATGARRLQAELASQPSATAVLQAICESRHGPGARIRALKTAVASDAAALAVARRRLRAPDEPVAYRRVELSCQGVIYSRAENWYLPARLTPGMNQALETTDTPFGAVVRPLDFRRRTLSSTILPGPDAVLRNRAILETPQAHPFSLVTETYSAAVVAPPR